MQQYFEFTSLFCRNQCNLTKPVNRLICYFILFHVQVQVVRMLRIGEYKDYITVKLWDLYSSDFKSRRRLYSKRGCNKIYFPYEFLSFYFDVWGFEDFDVWGHSRSIDSRNFFYLLSEFSLIRNFNILLLFPTLFVCKKYWLSSFKLKSHFYLCYFSQTHIDP